MNQEPLTLYKLIVLYMLDRVTFPLTTAQISEFVLDKEYTNFLTLQTAISELMETGLAESRTILTWPVSTAQVRCRCSPWIPILPF